MNIDGQKWLCGTLSCREKWAVDERQCFCCPFHTHGSEKKASVDHCSHESIRMKFCRFIQIIVNMMWEKTLSQAVSCAKEHTSGEHIGLVWVGLEKMIICSKEQCHCGCKIRWEMGSEEWVELERQARERRKKKKRKSRSPEKRFRYKTIYNSDWKCGRASDVEGASDIFFRTLTSAALRCLCPVEMQNDAKIRYRLLYGPSVIRGYARTYEFLWFLKLNILNQLQSPSWIGETFLNLQMFADRCLRSHRIIRKREKKCAY